MAMSDFVSTRDRVALFAALHEAGCGNLRGQVKQI
jgi:hypothetical protein